MTYSGPRSRCGPAPRRSATRAPPKSARSSGHRSETRRTYRSSSRWLSSTGVNSRTIVEHSGARDKAGNPRRLRVLSDEVVLAVRPDAGHRERLGYPARDVDDVLVGHLVERRDGRVRVDVLAE